MSVPLFPGEPLWNPEHSAGLRAFVVSPLGQLFLRRLIYARPTVTSDEREKRTIQSDERAGFEACITEILNLAEPKQISAEDVAAQTKS